MSGRKLSYDPTEFSSDEEYARVAASMDQEFGMPREAYEDSGVGRMVNRRHYEHQKAMNDEFGWGNTTDSQLRKRWKQ